MQPQVVTASQIAFSEGSLYFPEPHDREIENTLVFPNHDKFGNYLVFVVKSTSPARYTVTPRYGIISPDSTAEVNITLRANGRYLEFGSFSAAKETKTPVTLDDQFKIEFRTVDRSNAPTALRLLSSAVSKDYAPIKQLFSESEGGEGTTRIQQLQCYFYGMGPSQSQFERPAVRPGADVPTSESQFRSNFFLPEERIPINAALPDVRSIQSFVLQPYVDEVQEIRLTNVSGANRVGFILKSTELKALDVHPGRGVIPANGTQIVTVRTCNDKCFPCKVRFMLQFRELGHDEHAGPEGMNLKEVFSTDKPRVVHFSCEVVDDEVGFKETNSTMLADDEREERETLEGGEATERIRLGTQLLKAVATATQSTAASRLAAIRQQQSSFADAQRQLAEAEHSSRFELEEAQAVARMALQRDLIAGVGNLQTRQIDANRKEREVQEDRFTTQLLEKQDLEMDSREDLCIAQVTAWFALVRAARKSAEDIVTLLMQREEREATQRILVAQSAIINEELKVRKLVTKEQNEDHVAIWIAERAAAGEAKQRETDRITAERTEDARRKELERGAFFTKESHLRSEVDVEQERARLEITTVARQSFEASSRSLQGRLTRERAVQFEADQMEFVDEEMFERRPISAEEVSCRAALAMQFNSGLLEATADGVSVLGVGSTAAFSLQPGGKEEETVALSNLSSTNRIGFVLKCTDLKGLAIRPGKGVVWPGDTQTISIKTVNEDLKPATVRFMLQYRALDDIENVQDDGSNLKEAFAQNKIFDILSRQFSCETLKQHSEPSEPSMSFAAASSTAGPTESIRNLPSSSVIAADDERADRSKPSAKSTQPVQSSSTLSSNSDPNTGEATSPSASDSHNSGGGGRFGMIKRLFRSGSEKKMPSPAPQQEQQPEPAPTAQPTGGAPSGHSEVQFRSDFFEEEDEDDAPVATTTSPARQQQAPAPRYPIDAVLPAVKAIPTFTLQPVVDDTQEIRLTNMDRTSSMGYVLKTNEVKAVQVRPGKGLIPPLGSVLVAVKAANLEGHPGGAVRFKLQFRPIDPATDGRVDEDGGGLKEAFAAAPPSVVEFSCDILSR